MLKSNGKIISIIKENLWSQFGASIDMLTIAIQLWPERDWRTDKKFFYNAYHSMAPRHSFEGLGGDESLDKVWSITCFFVKKEHRGQAFVHLLIEQAKKYAKKQGADYLEAYPVETDSPSYKHMGKVLKKPVSTS